MNKKSKTNLLIFVQKVTSSLEQVPKVLFLLSCLLLGPGKHLGWRESMTILCGFLQCSVIIKQGSGLMMRINNQDH